MRLLLFDTDQARGQALRLSLEARDKRLDIVVVSSEDDTLLLVERASIDSLLVQGDRFSPVHGRLLRGAAGRRADVLRVAVVDDPGSVAAGERAHVQRCFRRGAEDGAIISYLAQARRLRDLLSDAWLRRTIGHPGALPSPPAIALELLALVGQPQVGVAQVAAVIEKDPALAAAMLRLASSAYFGLPRKIHSVSEAALYVGLEAVKALALSATVFQSFRLPADCRFSVEALQAHSLGVAQVSRNLFRDASIAEDAFLAGLFHDLGTLALAARVPSMYAEVLRAVATGHGSKHEVERELFGVSHAEVGAYLLAAWGFPTGLVDAVLLHHALGAFQGPELHLGAAVGYADTLANGGAPGSTHVESVLEQAGADVARARWFAQEHRLIS